MSVSRSRSRSRSPVREDSQDRYELDSSSEDNNDYQPPTPSCKKIHIDNYPSHWSYKNIRQFIKDRTNSSIISDSIKYVNYSRPKESYPTSTVEFTEPSICKQAFKQLKAKQSEKCEGNIIYIRWERSNRKKSSVSNATMSTGKNFSLKPTTPQVSHDTYGLNQSFLDQLGVKLPILNKIFVANLDRQVDEDKIKEVFGIAGQIVDVLIINGKDNKPKMAKIEYDHPLEAVQAISMFHNQELYGRQIVVKIDNVPNLHTKPLPAGLTTIGIGLGPNGTPMRGIRYAAEVQPLKDLLTTELRKIMALISPTTQNNSSQDTSSTMNMMTPTMNVHAMTPLNINTMTSYAQPMPVINPLINQQGLHNYQMIQGLLQQNTGNDSTANLAAWQAANMPQNLVGIGQTLSTGQNDMFSRSMLNMGMQQNSLMTNSQQDNGASNKDRPQSFLDTNRRNYEENKGNSYDKLKRKSEEREPNMMTTDMLIFNNLPSSVTLSALKNKMREVGDITFAEITDGGKAIVRFSRTHDAERCVKLFDRSKVDSQTIYVRFF